MIKPTEDINKEKIDALTKGHEELKEIKETKTKINTELKVLNEKSYDINNIIEEIENFERKYYELKNEANENDTFKRTRLEFDNIVQLKINLEPLKKVLKNYNDEISTAQKKDLELTKEQTRIQK